MKIVKAPPKVKFHNRAKVNKGVNKARCVHCLEVSTFRVFQANGVNRLACVMCLHSCRYHKHKSINQHKIVRHTKLTYKEKLKRKYLRTKGWLFGTRIRGPFGRRRKK